MPHHGIQSGHEERHQVEPHSRRHVPGEVPVVRQGHGELLGLFKVRDVAEDDNAFKQGAQGVQHDPDGVTQPG